MNTATYTPGMCNIGPAERRLRRLGGVVGLIATVSIFLILQMVDVSPFLHLVLFPVAFAGALGFLQDAFHFCVNFGFRGLYNLAQPAGKTDSVDQVDYRKADQRRALRIILLAGLIAVIIVTLSEFLALLI